MTSDSTPDDYIHQLGVHQQRFCLLSVSRI